MPNIHALTVQDARNKTPKKSHGQTLALPLTLDLPTFLYTCSSSCPQVTLCWPDPIYSEQFTSRTVFPHKTDITFCPKKEKGSPSSLTSEDYLCYSSIVLWMTRSSQGMNSSFSLSSHQVHRSTTIWSVSQPTAMLHPPSGLRYRNITMLRKSHHFRPHAVTANRLADLWAGLKSPHPFLLLPS